MRYSIHAHAIELLCEVPSLSETIAQEMQDFLPGLATSVASNFELHRSSPIRGLIKRYSKDEVLRHLSPTATRLNATDDPCEIYQHDERCWLIDDRWGICEINLLKSSWRSWILPDAIASETEIFEQSLMWPIVQLLRPRGLCVLPAAAVVRDGWGVLLLSIFNIEPELSAMVRAGFGIIGQRFVAVRDSINGMEMLHMPGYLERTMRGESGTETQRIDLTTEFSGSSIPQAHCESVMLIAAGRRPLSHMQRISPSNAAGAIRRAWPIAELHPQRRQGQLPSRMAKRCRVFEVQLSRNPLDLLRSMEAQRDVRLPKVA